MTTSIRERIGAVLRENKLVIAGELAIIVLIQYLQSSRVISSATIFLFLIGWASLWFRNSGWKALGMQRPTNWLRTSAIAIAIGVAYQFVSMRVIVPFLHRITNEPLDLSQFESLRGNIAMLVVWLAVSWIIAAFGEEMVYRGYVLNRFGDVFQSPQAGLWIGAIASSALFAMGHAYQGVTGIVETFIFACVMAFIYLANRRNLWLNIIAHGVYDTVAFIMIYLGLYP